MNDDDDDDSSLAINLSTASHVFALTVLGLQLQISAFSASFLPNCVSVGLRVIDVEAASSAQRRQANRTQRDSLTCHRQRRPPDADRALQPTTATWYGPATTAMHEVVRICAARSTTDE